MSTFSEYLHISQFYETIFLLVITIPMVMQVMLFKNQLWIYINLKRVEENEQHAKWLKQQEQQESTEIQKQIEEIQSDGRRSAMLNTTEQDNNKNQTEGGEENQGENKETKEEVPAQEVEYQKRGSKFAPPEINPTNEDNHEKPQLIVSQTRVMYFYEQVVDVYEKHLPVIIVVVVMGILTNNCDVFSLAMFFCYIISTFLLDYAEMFQKLKKEYQSDTIAPYVHLVSSCFLIAIFIDLFCRRQFFGA